MSLDSNRAIIALFRTSVAFLGPLPDKWKTLLRNLVCNLWIVMRMRSEMPFKYKANFNCMITCIPSSCLFGTYDTYYKRACAFFEVVVSAPKIPYLT